MTSAGVVVCCGLTTIDVVQSVTGDLVVGSKMVARETSLDVGGPAANAARTAALLGSRVFLHTLLGTGPLASLARSILDRDGVTVIDHAPADGRWSIPVSSALVTGDGERTVISANAVAAPAPVGDVVPADAAVVLVDGHHVSLAGQVIRANPEAFTVLDGGSWKDGLREIMPQVDLALVSADFAAPGGTDPQVRAGATWGRTHGAAAVSVIRGDQRWELPVPQVTAVDTLGAGDVLHGAVAHAFASGGATEAVAAIRWAIPVAARSCSYRGVTTWADESRDDAT